MENESNLSFPGNGLRQALFAVRVLVSRDCQVREAVTEGPKAGGVPEVALCLLVAGAEWLSGWVDISKKFPWHWLLLWREWNQVTFQPMGKKSCAEPA